MHLKQQEEEEEEQEAEKSERKKKKRKEEEEEEEEKEEKGKEKEKGKGKEKGKEKEKKRGAATAGKKLHFRNKEWTVLLACASGQYSIQYLRAPQALAKWHEVLRCMCMQMCRLCCCLWIQIL